MEPQLTTLFSYDSSSPYGRVRASIMVKVLLVHPKLPNVKKYELLY